MKKARLVYGVGRNDSDYPTYIGETVGGKSRMIWRCPFYRSWVRMLERCYSEKHKARHPTYIGCSVAEEWHSFSSFRDWMARQDWHGKQLDKDILLPGNKIYSAATCVFVSGQLNTFMLDCGASYGKYKIGVCWHKGAGKFMAQCCNPFTGKHEYLGLFSDQAEAREVWRRRKHELACIYADQQDDPRIASALSTRYTKNSEGEI